MTLSATAAVTATGTAAVYGASGFVVLWGTTVATAAGFMTAAQADQKVNFNATTESIRTGVRYEDTLVCDGQPLYIGEFVMKVPDGFGRLFWPSLGSPGFVGEFKEGKPTEGVFLSEAGVVVGRMKLNNKGTFVEADGHQPGDQPILGASCQICANRPAMMAEGASFRPCGHGTVCNACAKMLLESSARCLLCGCRLESLALA